MTGQVKVDYAAADAWKQRAAATAKAKRLARQAVTVGLRAVKARGPQADQLAEKARIANEEALRAAKEAEQVWAETSVILSQE